MTTKIKPALIICLSIILGSCITSCSKKIIYDKILFGKGGGFTGKYDDYFLSKDGGIYKKDNSTKTFALMFDLSKKETKNIFNEITANKLFEVGFNHPYNMSCYLEIVKGSVSNRIVWGDAKNPPPSAVIAIFNKLMSLTGSNNNNIKKK